MSTLLKMNGIPTFKSKTGFRYPKFWDYYVQHDAMHWRASEINLSQDVKDFAKADEAEKTFMTNILRLFTQNEIMVETGYAVMMRIFKPIEVQAMLAGFMAREITHIESYSLFTETIGLPNSIYSEFLDIPVMNNKAVYLEKAKIKKFEDYKTSTMTNTDVDKAYRRDVARMIAVYAGGTEFISLMAQFAMLLKFQFQGKYPGLCDLVTFSIRDETMHGIANSALFREYVSENTDIWDDALKFDIYQAIREVVAYEKDLIDYFNPPHIDHKDLKTYIEYRADIALKELGMKPNYNVSMPLSLEFMNDATNIMLVDFFSSTVSEYTKSVEGNFNDIDYTKWTVILDSEHKW